jgi:hypothetical protein
MAFSGHYEELIDEIPLIRPFTPDDGMNATLDTLQAWLGSPVSRFPSP